MSTNQETPSITPMDTTPEVGSVSTQKRCHHPDCGKPLVRREKERKSNFEARTHCDLVCSRTNPNVHAAQSKQYAKEREEAKRECEICSKKFMRRRSESKTNFALRRTCSRTCANEKQRRDAQARAQSKGKLCPICMKTFHRRIGETNSRFDARRTCSEQCGHKSRQRTLKQLNGSTWQAQVTVKKKKKEVTRSLPPTSPPPPIPPAPKPEYVEVWRPASLGGPFQRKVS